MNHLNLHLEGDDDLINQTQDTVTILSNYIENMETSVPKKRLDNLMRTLYNESFIYGSLMICFENIRWKNFLSGNQWTDIPLNEHSKYNHSR